MVHDSMPRQTRHSRVELVERNFARKGERDEKIMAKMCQVDTCMKSMYSAWPSTLISRSEYQSLRDMATE